MARAAVGCGIGRFVDGRVVADALEVLNLFVVVCELVGCSQSAPVAAGRKRGGERVREGERG